MHYTRWHRSGRPEGARDERPLTVTELARHADAVAEVRAAAVRPLADPWAYARELDSAVNG